MNVLTLKVLKKMTKFTTLMILLNSTGFSALSFACEPGSVSYKKSHFIVLKDITSKSNNLVMNGTSGWISISATNDEVIQTRPDGYTSKITVRSSYGQIADNFGLKVRKSTYTLETNKACDDFNIVSIATEPEIDIGTPDSNLSVASSEALRSYLIDENVVPTNHHSGDYMVRVHTPQLCADGKSVTVNIVRLNHQPIGISYQTISVLVDIENPGEILKETHPGRFLRNLCK